MSYAICMSANCEGCMRELFWHYMQHHHHGHDPEILTCGKHAPINIPKRILYGHKGEVIGATDINFTYPMKILTFEKRIRDQLYDFNIINIYLIDFVFEDYYKIQHVDLQKLKPIEPSLDILKSHFYVEVADLYYSLRCRIPHKDYVHPDYIIKYNSTRPNGDVIAYIYTKTELALKNLPTDVTIADKYEQIQKIGYDPNKN